MLGVISAGTMIIPGVSGSMMLMMLGYYETIISTISSFIKSALALDFASALVECQSLVPFGIGVLLGIVVIAKIVEKLLKRYPNATMWGIIGLVVTSPFAILWGVNLNINILMLLVSVVTFGIGFLVAKKLSK